MNKLDELISATSMESVRANLPPVKLDPLELTQNEEENAALLEQRIRETETKKQLEAVHKLSDHLQKYNTQIPVDDIIKILKIMTHYSNQELEDCTSQLISIFNFSIYNPTQFEAIQKIFLQLCKSPEISCEARLKLADTLFNEDETRVLSFQCFSKILEETGLNLILRIRAIGYLFSSNSEKHMERVSHALDKIVTDPSLHSEYVMKSLGEILATFKDPKRVAILTEVMWTFIAQKHHEISPKILACIYLLENRKLISDIMVKGVFIFLTSTMKNKQKVITYNQQADAADAVDRYGNPQQAAEAKEVLKKLGGNERNVYENEQSAHEVSESAIEFLNELKKKKILLKKHGIFYEDITKKLKELAKTNPKLEKMEKRVIGALDRITSDMSHVCGMDLREITQRIYDKIFDEKDLDYRETLVQRFYEELANSYGTCTSGHVNNLVNTFVGAIKITFEQQILSNYEARFRARMCQIKDDDLKGTITIAMMFIDTPPDQLDDDDRESLKAYHDFIKSNKDEVYEELHKEFVGGNYVSELQFVMISKKYFNMIKLK